MSAGTQEAAHGRHRRPPAGRPPLHRRILERLRDWREHRRAEAARDDAYAADLHELNADKYVPARRPPGSSAYVPANLPTLYPPPVVAGGPAPAAVLDDVPDERWPHLAPGAYDGDTHAFGMKIMKAGERTP